ncbi:MAG: sarcosine oxidase subunit gamma family protein [Paracoccaceae bacterium]
MSPDELLFVTGYELAPQAALALGEALAGRRHLAANVSDARAVFRINGPGARELIAKGAPVDLSPTAFGPGDLRRTRLGQVAAAFWIGDDDAFTLVCFRSVGVYVFDWLKASAASGARPGLF